MEDDPGLVERTTEWSGGMSDVGQPLVPAGAGHDDGEVGVGVRVLGPSEPAAPRTVGARLLDPALVDAAAIGEAVLVQDEFHRTPEAWVIALRGTGRAQASYLVVAVRLVDWDDRCRRPASLLMSDIHVPAVEYPGSACAITALPSPPSSATMTVPVKHGRNVRMMPAPLAHAGRVHQWLGTIQAATAGARASSPPALLGMTRRWRHWVQEAEVMKCRDQEEARPTRHAPAVPTGLTVRV